MGGKGDGPDCIPTSALQGGQVIIAAVASVVEDRYGSQTDLRGSKKQLSHNVLQRRETSRLR